MLLPAEQDIPLPFVTTITGPLIELYEAKSLVDAAMVALIDGANDECREHVGKLENLIAQLKRKVPMP